MPLDSAFISKIRDQGKGIILIEARKATTKPLMLELRQGTNLIARASLDLSISGVEDMFRHKNLMPNLSSPARRQTGWRIQDVPNEPETSDKSFVFLHGYNVNPQEARGLLPTYSNAFIGPAPMRSFMA